MRVLFLVLADSNLQLKILYRSVSLI